MIWVLWLILALALAFISPSEARKGLIVVSLGLVIVWLGKLGLSEKAFWPFSSLVWVVSGLIIATLNSRFSTHAALLLVVAGAFVFPAKISGVDYEFGNFWLAVSDVCGVFAIVALGWPGVSDLAFGNKRLGASSGPDSVSPVFSLGEAKEKT